MRTHSGSAGAQSAVSKRPRWWAWVRLSGLTFRDHAKALGERGEDVSHTHLWQIALEIDDTRRAMPSPELRRTLQVYSGGYVNADTDWPPLVQPAEPEAVA